MKRDTKRIEALLANTKENIKLVRAEMKAGASLQHIYDDLHAHERLLTARLKEIADWNKSQDAQQALADKAAADKAAADNAAADKAAADKAAETNPDNVIQNKKSLFKQYKNASQDELLAIQKSTAEALAKEPGRVDAQTVSDVVTELLKKFN